MNHKRIRREVDIKTSMDAELYINKKYKEKESK